MRNSCSFDRPRGEVVLVHLFSQRGRSGAINPSLTLVCGRENLVIGSNSVFLNGLGLRVQTVIINNTYVESDEFYFEFRHITKSQRGASLISQGKLNAVVAGRADVATDDWVPLIIEVQDGPVGALYHYAQQAASGAIFLKYYQGVEKEVALLASSIESLDAKRTLLNDDCWYSKWQSEMEIERKLTFEKIENIWALNIDLYKEILEGRLAGFVPELDREFQVFDYESHIYEVTGTASEQGYISFIPQADGRVTIKRKWFMQNAEVRREKIISDVRLEVKDFDAHVFRLTSASVRKMPVFRRKRFDVNFESVATGNVYGVYFDICRTPSYPAEFAQCEVEYCRSRTLFSVDRVMEEFEVVASYVEDYLKRQSVLYKVDLYSKLDFVRQASDLSAVNE